MKRFKLIRHEDETGISGTGKVADGIRFKDRTCVVRWKSENATTVIHDDLESVREIHCSHSDTSIEFVDGPGELNHREVESLLSRAISLCRGDAEHDVIPAFGEYRGGQEAGELTEVALELLERARTAAARDAGDSTGEMPKTVEYHIEEVMEDRQCDD